MQPSLFTINHNTLKEMYKLHKLYVYIIEAFHKRLILETGSSKSHLYINENQVNEFIEVIKYFLNKQTETYDQVVCLRESGVSKSSIGRDINAEQDLEFKEIISSIVNSDVKKEDQLSQQQPEVQSLNIFSEYSPERQLCQKINEISQQSEREARRNEEITQPFCETDDQQDKYVQIAEKQTTYLIFGKLSRQKIKRNSKTSKTIIFFDDMFVKCFANGRDAYFQRGMIELTQIQKEEAKIL